MNVTCEIVNGKKTFIGRSHSGKWKLTADTLEELRRKELFGLLHMQKHRYPEDLFNDLVAQRANGSTSLKDCSTESLEDLLKIFTHAQKVPGTNYSPLTKGEHKGVVASPSTANSPKLLTESQRKMLVRLGKYRIGSVYGEKYFWEKMEEHCGKRNLDDLTSKQAWHLCQVLEKIEAALVKSKRLSAN